MTSKKEAQKTIRSAKSKAAKAESRGDRVTARGHQAHADLVRDKLLRGDYGK